MTKEPVQPEQLQDPLVFLELQMRNVKTLQERLVSDDPMAQIIRPATQLALDHTIEIVRDHLSSDEIISIHSSLEEEKEQIVVQLESLPNLTDEERLTFLRDAFTSERFKPLRLIEAAASLAGSSVLQETIDINEVPVPEELHAQDQTDEIVDLESSIPVDDVLLESAEVIEEPIDTLLSIRYTENKGTILKVGKGRGKLYRLTAPQTDAIDYSEHKIAFLKLFEGKNSEKLKITDIIQELRSQNLLNDDNKTAVLGAIRQLVKSIEFYGQPLIEHNHITGNASAYYVNPAFAISEVKDTRISEQTPVKTTTPVKEKSDKKEVKTQTAKSEGQIYTIEKTMEEKIENGELPIFEIVAALHSLEARRDLIEFLSIQWVDSEYVDRISKILDEVGLKAPSEYHDPQKKEVLRNKFMKEFAQIISDSDLYEKLFDLVDSSAQQSEGHLAVQELVLDLAGLDDIAWEKIQKSVIPAKRNVSELSQSFAGGSTSMTRFETMYVCEIDNETVVLRFKTGETDPTIEKVSSRFTQSEDGSSEEIRTIPDELPEEMLERKKTPEWEKEFRLKISDAIDELWDLELVFDRELKATQLQPQSGSAILFTKENITRLVQAGILKKSYLQSNLSDISVSFKDVLVMKLFNTNRQLLSSQRQKRALELIERAANSVVEQIRFQNDLE